MTAEEVLQVALKLLEKECQFYFKYHINPLTIA